jgi:hypothetical protein
MDDDKQIPCGNDRKKGKNNSRSKDEAEKQIPFGSDRNKGKGRSKDKKGPSLTGLRLCSG